jgi:hypothetical protein
MSFPTETTYVTSFPKRNDITGAPDQVFKFDNFLDYLTGGIRANTIAAIGTINPGSLCIQYLFAPQIHYDLSGTPIAFIGNSSNKKGEFSMIKVNIESIRVFAYIKDKATWAPDLRLGLILGGALFYARVTFETLVVFLQKSTLSTSLSTILDK